MVDTKELKTAKDKLKICSILRIVSENYLKDSEAEEDKRINVLHEKKNPTMTEIMNRLQNLRRVLFGDRNQVCQLGRRKGRTPPCLLPAHRSQSVATSQSPPQLHHHGNPALADGIP